MQTGCPMAVSAYVCLSICRMDSSPLMHARTNTHTHTHTSIVHMNACGETHTPPVKLDFCYFSALNQHMLCMQICKNVHTKHAPPQHTHTHKLITYCLNIYTPTTHSPMGTLHSASTFTKAHESNIYIL